MRSVKNKYEKLLKEDIKNTLKEHIDKFEKTSESGVYRISLKDYYYEFEVFINYEEIKKIDINLKIDNEGFSKTIWNKEISYGRIFKRLKKLVKDIKLIEENRMYDEKMQQLPLTLKRRFKLKDVIK